MNAIDCACDGDGWERQAKAQCAARSASLSSLCSSQTLASAAEDSFLSSSQRAPSFGLDAQTSFKSAFDDSDAFYASPSQDPAADEAMQSWLQPAQEQREPNTAYTACLEMIRCHKLAELPNLEQLSRLADGANLDDGSRVIVVSWMVEVAEEFGLQQETLHAAVALLDRFLSTSNSVPRCVMQLVAVGCIFLASKQLEVHPRSVEQMVAVTAHSITAADLLRVERILLDAMEFNITTPTPYGFLHLLTQASLAAGSCSISQQRPSDPAAAPQMEAVVSLAMYLTELALLDQSCLVHAGSKLATAALLLAHATFSRHCGDWPQVLAAAGMDEAAVGPALAALGRLHAAAAAPTTPQLDELLQPLKFKFGQDCWCRVAAEVTPLALWQQQQHVALV